MSLSTATCVSQTTVFAWCCAGIHQFTTKTAFYLWAPTSCGPGAITSAGVACPLGHFCIGGVPTLCAAGTYGDSTGLSSAACSGNCNCESGAYCPPGSSAGPSGVCVSCPPGAYCTGGTAKRVAVQLRRRHCVPRGLQHQQLPAMPAGILLCTRCRWQYCVGGPLPCWVSCRTHGGRCVKSDSDNYSSLGPHLIRHFSVRLM
jgi:hypothetical protein